jgi:hypothetical protein
VGLNVMAALWPLRAGSLHVDFWVSERVLKKAGPVRNRSVSGPERDGRILAIAFRVLTRRFLGQRTRFEKSWPGFSGLATVFKKKA